jgi:drug/metabolite transporter (DMT)-like permease
MRSQILKSDGILLMAAVIWGFAFVAQRVGMKYVGPFTFNGIRFALGVLVLLPVMRNRRNTFTAGSNPGRTYRFGPLLAGVVLFAGTSLQQFGLVYTTAGNAGFITGLYVIMVPMLGLFFGQRTNAGTWLGAVAAAVGLYFLSLQEYRINIGDLLVLIGALAWAAHVLIIGWLSPQMDSLRLAVTQYIVCSALSLLMAVIFERMTLEGIYGAALPILYSGALSVGVAFTLQVVGQRIAHPSHAAIILSLETVVAAFGGWLILNELLSQREMIGCGLMLVGMLLSQLWGMRQQMKAQYKHS